MTKVEREKQKRISIMVSDRNVTIDVLRSISILGVVWIHGAYLFAYAEPYSQIISNACRFAVPCFVIAWAYFWERAHLREGFDVWIYYKRRSAHLLAIFGLWSLIYFLRLADWPNLSIKDIITKHWSGYGWSGQYFFIIIFQLIVFYPLLRYLFSKPQWRLTLLAVCLTLYLAFGYWSARLPGIAQKLGDRPFVFWIPQVFFGIYLARNTTARWSWLACLAIVVIPTEFAILQRLKIDHGPYISPGVLLASSLFAAPFFSNRLPKTSLRFEAVIQYLGRNTMIVFVANPLVIMLVGSCISNRGELSPFLSLPIQLLTVLLLTAACLFIGMLMKRTPLRGLAS